MPNCVGWRVTYWLLASACVKCFANSSPYFPPHEYFFQLTSPSIVVGVKRKATAELPVTSTAGSIDTELVFTAQDAVFNENVISSNEISADPLNPIPEFVQSMLDHLSQPREICLESNQVWSFLTFSHTFSHSSHRTCSCALLVPDLKTFSRFELPRMASQTSTLQQNSGITPCSSTPTRNPYRT